MSDTSNTGVFSHDPEAKLDYNINWSDWLDEGETITDVIWNIPEGLVEDTDLRMNVDGITTVWLSGGLVSRTQKVECKITTSLGRTDERTIRLSVRER